MELLNFSGLIEFLAVDFFLTVGGTFEGQLVPFHIQEELEPDSG